MSAYEVVWIDSDHMKKINKNMTGFSYGAFMLICTHYWETGEGVEPSRAAIGGVTNERLTDEEWEVIQSEVIPALQLVENGLIPPADLWRGTDPYVDEFIANQEART